MFANIFNVFMRAFCASDIWPMENKAAKITHKPCNIIVTYHI